MRIAFVSTILDYPWGGADTLWTHAAEAAAERGDVLLLSVSPAVAAAPRITALRSAGATVHERTAPIVPGTPAARVARKLRSLAGGDALVAALTSFRPDLVVFSLGGTYDLAFHSTWCRWLIASGVRFRLVANWQQEHPVLFAADREFVRECFARAADIFFVSNRNLASTRRHLLDPLARARVIQNPLRWRSADSSPWPGAPGWRLATVSRLDEGKGVSLLLHAAARALSAEDDWSLHIYGRGPTESYLRETAAHLRLEARVQFHGFVGSLKAIWKDHHLLVSPSLEDGVPMTIPEAMLCGRPVLATAVGGAEDWIRHDETGFICPAPTVDLLAATLAHAWARRAQWSALGTAARVAATARYQPEDFRLLIA